MKNKNLPLKNKYTMKFILIFLLIFINIYFILYLNNYIPDNKKRDINPNYFLSICIPVYNMEKYIEKSILSIKNQTFPNFEIIIVNDNSNDNTHKIIQRFQNEDNRIKIINHKENLGVYKSRIDAAFNAKGKYILYVDPDDMLYKRDLFEHLYNYSLKYNLDIIEFSVHYHEEGKNNIYIPHSHILNHYHKFKKNIISQPELSNIIFYNPNTLSYTYIICRTIWNKIIRKSILIKSIEYVDTIFHNIYLIAADDTPLNILSFNYANNYTNINIPGYLYNKRKKSMSRTGMDKKHDFIVSYNYLLYLHLFYKYLKDFNKNLIPFFHELKFCKPFILKLKYLSPKYNKNIIDFFNEIINNNIPIYFKNYIKSFIIYFNK